MPTLDSNDFSVQRISWTFTADGTGTSQQVYPSGKLAIEARGDLGGGTVTVNSSRDGSSWTEVAVITTDGQWPHAVLAAKGEYFQAILASSTAPDFVLDIYQVEG